MFKKRKDTMNFQMSF